MPLALLQLALFGLSPFWNNVLIALMMVVYVFSLVALLDFCVANLGLARDLSRKITHIGAGCLVLFLALFDDSHWSKYLNITILVIWFFLLIQKGLFADANDEAVKTMTRTGDRTELLKGPLYFVIVSIICGTIFYKTFAGVAAMGFLTFGDGLAPVVGTRIGKLKYHIFSQKKSRRQSDYARGWHLGRNVFCLGCVATGIQLAAHYHAWCNSNPNGRHQSKRNR